MKHVPLLLLWSLLLALSGPFHADAASSKKADVRIQITYLTVTGTAQFAPPDFNPHFDDPRQALRAFQYQARRQQMTVSPTPGPVVTVADGATGTAVTGTALGSALARTADGKEIDDHVASFHEHHLTARPGLSHDGTISVDITLTDSAYTADDRTHRHIHDETPRVVHKTLAFRPGDTLLLSAPAPNTAGGDYVFATLTQAPTAKG